jgi:hypothetical protein
VQARVPQSMSLPKKGANSVGRSRRKVLLLVTGPYLYTHAPMGPDVQTPMRWACTTVQYGLQWCTLNTPP